MLINMFYKDLLKNKTWSHKPKINKDLQGNKRAETQY